MARVVRRALLAASLAVAICASPPHDARAATAIAQAPPAAASSGGIDALLPRLKEKDPALVAQTLRSLGARGDVRAFRPIIDTVSRSIDPEVRAAGLAALEKLDYTLPFLIDALKDPAQPALARAYAAFMLGQMRSPDAVPPLIAALESRDEDVREKAMEALGRIKDQRAWKPLIVAAHKDPSPALRAKAQRTVEAMASQGADSAHDPELLASQLKDPDVSTRRNAAQALSRFGTWWSVRPLIDALSDADSEVRRYAARALGDLQDKRAVEPLVAFLDRSSGLARLTAIAALGVLKDDAAVDGLTRYLKDPDGQTRRQAARALGLIGARRAGPALAEALKDIVPENRREAAHALGLVKDPGTLPQLMTLVREDVEENQIEATRSMGKIGSLEAVPLLIRLLDDKNPVIGITAVGALKELGSPDAIPALEQVSRRTKDGYLKEEALEASIELRGKAKRKEP
jgi:HEAT repeat protein